MDLTLHRESKFFKVQIVSHFTKKAKLVFVLFTFQTQAGSRENARAQSAVYFQNKTKLFLIFSFFLKLFQNQACHHIVFQRSQIENRARRYSTKYEQMAPWWPLVFRPRSGKNLDFFNFTKNP